MVLEEEGEAKEFFMEFGAFYDAYIIHRVLAATMMTTVILNLPWLLHCACPEFNFPKLIFKAGETSPAGLYFLHQFKEEVEDLCKNGLELELKGYPKKTQLITKTKIEVNRKHMFLFAYSHCGSGDLKRQLGVAGSKATNMTYLPHLSLTCATHLFQSVYVRMFGEIITIQETFRAEQNVLLEKELIGIKENTKWSEEEK